MPDSEFLTLSATEIPALLGLSPWQTPLMLYHEFKKRERVERPQSLRMKLGKFFEPEIMAMAAERLVLELRPNTEQTYHRHPMLPIGCTMDYDVQCPTRGYGIVEAKAIDKDEFKKNWTETAGPRMYEVQLQTAMLATGATWGVLAPFIYNDGENGILELYERRPHAKARARITHAARQFFTDLEDNRPPPVFGNPIEIDLMNELYPEVEEAKILDATDDFETAEMARLYQWTDEQAKGFARAAAEMKPKLLGFTKDHALTRLGGGVSVRVSKPQMAGQVVFLPFALRQRLLAVAKFLDEETIHSSAAVREACEWAHIVRKPGIQNRLSIRESERPEPAEKDEPLMNIEA